MQEKISKEELRQFIHINDRYRILEHIGEGTFSTVYKAVDLKSNSKSKYVAIKNITRTSAPHRVAEELKFLHELGGKYNVIELLDCKRFEDQIIAVFPHFEFTEFRDFLKTASVLDVKYYMYNLLKAVAHVHANKIIHRDIKPSNFLYNRETRKGLLIDFGLAQYEKPEQGAVIKKERRESTFLSNSFKSREIRPPGYFMNDARPNMKAQRAGTRGFRAPEVLFRKVHQTSKIDVWSVGVVFLTLLCKQYPFFHSMDDNDALVEIACIFGHEEMKKAARFYNRIWRSNIVTVHEDKIPFEDLIMNFNPQFQIDLQAFDLMYMLLDLYDEKRISAKEALSSPFFDDVRN